MWKQQKRNKLFAICDNLDDSSENHDEWKKTISKSSIYLPFLKWEHDGKGEQLSRCQGLRRKWSLGERVCGNKRAAKSMWWKSLCVLTVICVYIPVVMLCYSFFFFFLNITIGRSSEGHTIFLFCFVFYNNCMKTYSNLAFLNV